MNVASTNEARNSLVSRLYKQLASKASGCEARNSGNEATFNFVSIAGRARTTNWDETEATTSYQECM